MKGILFKPEMINAIIDRRKTMTRRLSGIPVMCEKPHKDVTQWLAMGAVYKPKFKVGETVYIKEGFYFSGEFGVYVYKADKPHITFKWKSPMFMPEKAARYFIEITDVKVERLQDMSHADAKAEGVFPIGHRCAGLTREGKKDYPWCPDENTGIHDCFKCSFRHLWYKIHKDNSYEDNPWVWVYSFILKK